MGIITIDVTATTTWTAAQQAKCLVVANVDERRPLEAKSRETY